MAELVLEAVRAQRDNGLPVGWSWTTLSEASEVIMGQSPPSETYNSEGRGLPFFQGKAEFGDLYPDVAKWCSAPNKIAEADDILISVRAPVGPTNISREKSCIGRGLAAIRPVGMPNRYLLYYLRFIEDEWDSKATGTTFKAISGQTLRSQELPLAPLAEQQRIVEEIEVQFTRLDAGVAALKRTKRKLQRYRASVLKAACAGRLVPQDAMDEPASELLQRILAERRAQWEAAELAKMEAKGKHPKDDRWKEKYQEPAAPDTEGLPELPKGWEWTVVAQLSTKVTDGTHSTPKYVDKGVPFLSVNNMSEDGVLNLNPCKYISVEQHEELYRRCDPEKGDVLLSKVGTVGLSVAIKTEVAFSLFVNAALIKPIRGLVLPDFLAVALRFGFISKKYDKDISGSTQKFIGTAKIASLAVPLPPLAEQQRIVEEVERRLSVVIAMEAAVKANLKRAERLRQSVLKQAFAGKLVPQDPTDEPASALLARIRAARNGGDTKVKQGRLL